MSVPQDLFEAALEARRRAYAPYSHFQVGAAVRDRGGAITIGCNVENASYGLCCCAERVALFDMVAAARKEPVEICVVADVPDVVSPCGACRQVIYELAKDALVWLCNTGGASRQVTAADLLPFPFSLERPDQPKDR
jgi:cytidine deaminase